MFRTVIVRLYLLQWIFCWFHLLCLIIINDHDPGNLPVSKLTNSLSEARCSANVWPSSRVRCQLQLRGRTEQHRTTNDLHMASAAVLVCTRWIVGDVVPMGQEDGIIKPLEGWRQELDTHRETKEYFMMALSAGGCSCNIVQKSKHPCMYVHTTSRFTWQLTPPLPSISFHSPPGPAFRQPISSRLTRDKAWWSGSVSTASLAHARCWLVLQDRLLTHGRCCRESSSAVETNLKATGLQGQTILIK